jgi:hypothetical protein
MKLLEAVWHLGSSRSDRDKSIMQLFHLIRSLPDLSSIRENGLLPRQIRYLLGIKDHEVVMKNEGFSQLVQIRKLFIEHGGRSPEIPIKNARRIVDNHIRKLVKMGVLRKIIRKGEKYGRYSDGPCLYFNPSEIDHLKNQIAQAKQEKCWSNGHISIFPTIFFYGEGKVSKKISSKAASLLALNTDLIVELYDLYQPHDEMKLLPKPIIVIDLNRIADSNRLIRLSDEQMKHEPWAVHLNLEEPRS